MKDTKSPMFGAILNVLIFGAADMYVGKFGTGILKFLYAYVIFFIVGATIENVASRYTSYIMFEWVQFSIRSLYILISGMMGYRTVIQHQKREE